MMKKKIYSSILLISVILSSCGGGDSDDTAEVMPPILAPEAASLVFPEDDTECNISEVLSETQSTVPFEWVASENTDSYQLRITNLNTNALLTPAPVSEPEAFITLERGTPYEWLVISRANGTTETATSSTFRFFNEGPGIENYAPFPASAINPTRGVPQNSLGVISQNTMDVDVTSGQTYFWRIISIDDQANRSQSEVFSFRVN